MKAAANLTEVGPEINRAEEWIDQLAAGKSLNYWQSNFNLLIMALFSHPNRDCIDSSRI